MLLVASYFFYGWWSWKFLILLALSTLLDFLYGFGVASPKPGKAKLFLWLSVINNLGILGVFKYYNFFAAQFKTAFLLAGIHINPAVLQVALPVGISFYTFHGMSYVFDIYRQKQKPVTNFIDYAVFVGFFPLLVAGPIERAHHLLPQVRRNRTFNYQQAIEGCRLMLWGMFKKVVIADYLAKSVDTIFGNYAHESGLSLIIGAVAFSFQIYGDFSGYSDIAIGTAKLLGFELLSNFRFPYFSRDIAEFWRRWHISLSSWFRDYLYIPLGGSKEGKLKAVRNTFIIFVVSGFWHGASWNFIVWGAIHACGFLPLLLLNTNRRHVSTVVAENSMLPSPREAMQMLGTFVFVTIAWVFFRAANLHIAVDFLRHIFLNIHDLHRSHMWTDIAMRITPLLLFDWYNRRNERLIKFSKYPALNLATYYGAIIVMIVALAFQVKEVQFIYFQF